MNEDGEARYEQDTVMGWSSDMRRTIHAYVTLNTESARRGGQVYQWVILDCPLCHEEHYHGAGADDDDPNRFLGSRLPHCRPKYDRHCRVTWQAEDVMFELTTDESLHGKDAELCEREL